MSDQASDDVAELNVIPSEITPGHWLVYQKWLGSHGYQFWMTVEPGGTISISNGAFTGVSQTLPSGYVSLAIANYAGKSVTDYVGHNHRFAMHGNMSGVGPDGHVHHGHWVAYLRYIHEAKEGDFAVGS